jgi:multiple sugar transport system substrate-binding protein
MTTMSTVRSLWRVLVIALAAAFTTASVAACSSGGSGTNRGPYMVWDPYSQFGAGSAWVQSLDKCAKDNGATVRRTVVNSADVVAKEVKAENQGLSPDILIVDNVKIPALVSGSTLVANAQTHLSDTAVEPNLLAAGAVGNSTYGVPVGADTLALFYNKDILKTAGVDPSALSNWSTLQSALAKVKAAGKTGITFSAVGSEEGSLQFEPWLWGAGSNLANISSPQAVTALSLWTGWLKDGYAANSVLKDSPAASWQQFAAGGIGFAEAGSTKVVDAGKLGFPYGVIAIPRESGGPAPVPVAGEFITIPVQTGTNRYAVDDKIVSCLTGTVNAAATDSALSYVGVSDALQSQQVNKNAALGPFVDAARTAQARTGDGLGGKYQKTSQQLGNAVQAALSGSATPQAALSAAQKSVG